LSARPKKQEESGPKVPAYIVTFSDMITLLLTFFVMLLSLASEQDPELYNKTRDAFNDSINNIGLGMLQGRRSGPELGQKLLRHKIQDPDDDADIRTVDADEERRRRLFKKVADSMQTLKSQIIADSIRYTVSRVRFPESASSLDAESKTHLDQFSRNVMLNAQKTQTKLYVLGIASDVQGLRNQWILSAQRAQAVAAYLRRALPDTGQYPVFSWGSGLGGNWVGESGYASKDAHIFIAVLK
jgi:flagellar motor protein MotB